MLGLALSPASTPAEGPYLEAHNAVAHEYGQPIDPGQAAVGLSPETVRPIDHPINTGPPEFLTADAFPPPLRLTQVAITTPLYTVVQVIQGVAIFGTNGGRAITP